jgi:phage-related protein
MSVWVEVFVVVAAIAIVIQSAMLVAMFLQLKTAITEITKITNELQNRMGPILLRVSRILDDSEERIHSIMSDASEITRVARTQAQKVDRVFSEALDRLRTQILRADQILTGTLEVIEDTGSKFKNTVWRPVQQASALIKGIKVGIDVLRGRRDNADGDAVTEDEELFI